MNYGHIYYHLEFEKIDYTSKMKAEKVRLSVMNHQVTVYYDDHVNKCDVYRIIDCSEEHEVLSLMSYYQGMGYMLVEYKRRRMTLLSEKERFEREEQAK